MKIILTLLFVATCFAQTVVGPRASATGTYANRPSSAATNTIYVVTDDASAGACTGGGSARSQCQWSGSAWVALGGSGGSSGAALAAGTATLATSSVTANSCATAVVPTATSGSLSGVTTADVVLYSPSADLSSVTGYGALSTDGLIVYPYPSTDHVNFKVCNATASNITPGAATLNWIVVRGSAASVASGTATLLTSSIGANSCASAVIPTATGGSLTGVLTSDVVLYVPTADLSSTTGYGVLSTDGLVIYPYPTADHVNFKVCNVTGSSITPGAATLNWKVVR